MAQAVEISQIGQPTMEILSLFPKQGEWTEYDYFRLPETNRIIELSEGRLIISPSPTPKHQDISARLFFLFANYVFSRNLGKVVTAPMDTRLYEGVVRQPDIEFMSNEHLDRITNIWGVPDLVVEILSEGTAKEDKEDKFKEYQRAGVPEYWIVDPFNQSIEVYTLQKRTYKLFGKWGLGEIAKSKLLDGLEVSVDEVMA
jgi:Uma2 family endonuclease